MKHRLISLIPFAGFSPSVVAGLGSRSHLGLTPIVSFLLAFAAALTGHAATISVSNTNDSGAGSLRTALATAGNGDVIDATGLIGAISLASQLIVSNSVAILGPGPASLSVMGSPTNRVFHITNSVTAAISGLTITNGNINGASGGGIWNNHSTLTVSNCVIVGNGAGDTGGGFYNDGQFGTSSLSVFNSTISRNVGVSGGAGIFNNGQSGNATLVVSNCVIRSNNTNQRGGGIFNQGLSGRATLSIFASTVSSNSTLFNDGGGIYNYGELGTGSVTVVNSAIDRNESSGPGGGIANVFGTLSVSNSSVNGNTAGGTGGGIFNHGQFGKATVTVTASSVSGNLAFNLGGGIYNRGNSGTASVTIVTSTIDGNTSTIQGGGIYNDGGGNNSSATISIIASTFTFNFANSGGGAVLNSGVSGGSATLSMTASTITSNQSGAIYNSGQFGSAVVLVNASTFSENYDPADVGISNDGDGALLQIGDTILKAVASGTNIVNFSGTVTSFGYNLASDNGGGFLTATGDQINQNPMLGPLAGNGGPTLTHVLLPGSPAIDKGKRDAIASLALNSDQRGFPRPENDPCVSDSPTGDGSDIGAFERQDVCEFRITAITPETSNIRITWAAVAGKTNRLERTAGVAGSFTNNFTAITNIFATGTTTNCLDAGAATNAPAFYYRVRLVP